MKYLLIIQHKETEKKLYLFCDDYLPKILKVRFDGEWVELPKWKIITPYFIEADKDSLIFNKENLEIAINA